MNAITYTKRSITGACVGLLMMISSATVTEAQSTQIAQIKTVSGQVFIQRGGARQSVKVGDPVFEKDTIDTGADGSIGITFIDNTVMSAGPNSEIALEDYKFDSNNFKGSMLTDLNKGTLSMVSGDIAKSSPSAMKVKTPDAILGVRGTHFVVQVPED